MLGIRARVLHSKVNRERLVAAEGRVAQFYNVTCDFSVPSHKLLLQRRRKRQVRIVGFCEIATLVSLLQQVFFKFGLEGALFVDQALHLAEFLLQLLPGELLRGCLLHRG